MHLVPGHTTLEVQELKQYISQFLVGVVAVFIAATVVEGITSALSSG